MRNRWHKIGIKPVFGDKEIGIVFDPFVRECSCGMLMLYSNRKNKCLESVVSNDGIRWSNRMCVLNGIEGTWENVVNRGCFIRKDGKYYLWYTGQNDGKSAIGLAVCNDGVHFIRQEQNPILKADKDYEGVSVMNPCVLWNEQKKIFQIWYAAGENYEPDVICYAESIDGLNWQKYNKPVLTKNEKHWWEKYKIGGCEVAYENGMYTMYYIGYQDLNTAYICFATSNDGIKWHRHKLNMIIAPSLRLWDSNACYKPTIIQRGKKLFLWYNGRKGEEEYIGLATKEII